MPGHSTSSAAAIVNEMYFGKFLVTFCCKMNLPHLNPDYTTWSDMQTSPLELIEALTVEEMHK